jgi:hypothetical protein
MRIKYTHGYSLSRFVHIKKMEVKEDLPRWYYEIITRDGEKIFVTHFITTGSMIEGVCPENF